MLSTATDAAPPLVPLLTPDELRMLIHLARVEFNPVCGSLCRVLIGHGLAERIIRPGYDRVYITDAGRRFLLASP